MKKKTLQTITKHNLIEKGMHIVLGLSGGPDSVCLFDLLRNVADEFELKLYAVHVNHKFRPGAAEEDQQYVEELCKKHQVPCYTYVTDCNVLAAEEGLTSEEAGRKARYDAFGRVAEKLHQQGIKKEKIAIALAHNANDQCETILFRLMRGTGTDGLAGIPYMRFDEKGFKIIRPILDLKREEIEKYCEDRNLQPRIDHTNNENLYARNKIRNLLIPYLEDNYNENIVDTINRLGKIAAQDKDYMNVQAQKAYEKAFKSMVTDDENKEVSLDTNVLRNLHNAIRFRVYTTALEKVGMEQNITYAQGELIDKVLVSKSPSAMCDLTDGFVVLREYESIVFKKNLTKCDVKLSKKQVETSNCGENYKFLSMTPCEFEEYKQNAKVTFGAFQGVAPKELCVRTRKSGDVINTGNGTKKIQDFFVDQKVPKHCREDIKLLAKGSKILWVLPSENFPSENMRQKGRFSADFRAQKDTEDMVIVLEILCTL